MIVRTRTRGSEAMGSEVTRLLDWFGRAQGPTVDFHGTYFDGPKLSELGEGLLLLGGSVYCADRIANRSDAPFDSWRRRITLQIGLSQPDAWRAGLDPLTDALDFLSGDDWEIAVRASAGRIPQVLGMTTQEEMVEVQRVCLFSGGLDSLCGAITLLDAGETVALVGHYENGLASKRQRDLARELQGAYGPDRVRLFQLRLGPASPAPGQARPLPSAELRDSTFRARSMLFICAGLALADAFGPDVPLVVPENGFIGINVPLRATRAGASSTRTTHPWFMDRVKTAFASVGIGNPIENPFRLMTKGEIIQAVQSDELLETLIATSLSCAHPESLFHFGYSPQHCGYCFPCLIRQASIHAAGLEDRTPYAFEVLDEDDFLDPSRKRASDLLAVLSSLNREAKRLDVLRNGPVAGEDVGAFTAVYERGRQELRAWIEDLGSANLRAALR